MNYSPEQLLDAWKKGKPLGDAVFNYVDKNLKVTCDLLLMFYLKPTHRVSPEQ